MLEHEVSEAGAVHLEYHLAGQNEHGVAQGFGLKLAAVHPPEESVLAVDFFVCLVCSGRLTVSGAGEDESVQLLDRLPVVAELCRQPVEQLRVGRSGSHLAEVVWRRHDAVAEVVLPDAVDDGTPCERVIRFCEPAGEGDAPVALRVVA